MEVCLVTCPESRGYHCCPFPGVIAGYLEMWLFPHSASGCFCSSDVGCVLCEWGYRRLEKFYLPFVKVLLVVSLILIAAEYVCEK